MRIVLAAASCALLLAAGTSPATGAPIHLGVKGGIGISNVSFDDSSEELADSRTGLAVGAYLGFPVAPMVSIVPEVIYREVGDSEEFDENGTTVTLTLELSYVEIPVLLRIAPVTGTSMSPWFGAGPSVAFNVSSNLKGEAGGGSAEFDIGEITKSVDFGVAFAGGLDFGIGPGGQTVGFEVRYTLGLADVFDGLVDDQGNIVTGGPSDGKNQTFSILATVGFL